MGKTIFLSSQVLADVTRICNHVGIMDAGKLVAYGSVKELKARLSLANTIQIKVLGKPERIHSLLKSNPYVSDIFIYEIQSEKPITTIQVKFSGNDEKIIELLTVLVRLGFQVLSFEVDADEFEDVFLHITKGTIS
jgi:ABC-2 type transport system ATP-binding protein